MSITFWCDEEHEINLSNTNAVVMLKLLDLPQEYAGEVQGFELARRATRAINVRRKHQSGMRPTEIDGNTIMIGLTEEQVIQRLKRLQIIGTAAATGIVYWA